MNRTVLQIPIAPSLRQQAEAVSLDLGFSSLQETVRVILKKLAHRELTVSIVEEKSVKLSKKAAARYDRMYQDFKKGRNVYYADDADDFFKQLAA